MPNKRPPNLRWGPAISILEERALAAGFHDSLRVGSGFPGQPQPTFHPVEPTPAFLNLKGKNSMVMPDSLPRRAAGVMLAALSLAACATVPPKIEYVQVPLAVAGSCIPPALPPAPTPETANALMSLTGPERYVRLGSDWLALKAWVVQAGPVIAACR